MKIPPLPPQRTGECPWCEDKIFADENGAFDLAIFAKLEGHSACPQCKKAIFVGRRRYDNYPYVKAERSETDKRYMAMMGVKDD